MTAPRASVAEVLRFARAVIVDAKAAGRPRPCSDCPSPEACARPPRPACFERRPSTLTDARTLCLARWVERVLSAEGIPDGDIDRPAVVTDGRGDVETGPRGVWVRFHGAWCSPGWARAIAAALLRAADEAEGA